MVLETAVREGGIPTNGVIYNQTSQIMAFADDVLLIARTEENLRKGFKILEKPANYKDLSINESKTNLMGIERTPSNN